MILSLRYGVMLFIFKLRDLEVDNLGHIFYCHSKFSFNADHVKILAQLGTVLCAKALAGLITP